MMHKAWSRIEEVPCCFLRLSVKLQGHTAKQKSSILTQIGHFRTVTPVWIHQWLRNDAQSLKYHRRGALLFFKLEEVPYGFSWSYVKLQGHMGKKFVDFDLNYALPNCNSSLNSPMAMKWSKKLAVALKRCLIVFQGHPSNFKVTWDKNRQFWLALSVSGL